MALFLLIPVILFADLYFLCKRKYLLSLIVNFSAGAAGLILIAFFGNPYFYIFPAFLCLICLISVFASYKVVILRLSVSRLLQILICVFALIVGVFTSFDKSLSEYISYYALSGVALSFNLSSGIEYIFIYKEPSRADFLYEKKYSETKESRKMRKKLKNKEKRRQP